MSPSKTKEEFEKFCIDLNLLLSNVSDLNIPLLVLTGNFNARFLNWWSLNKQNAGGREINSLTSACG